jgi:phospholipid/cholesterol/gamma-HCH transport system substrate-binding protein
MAERSAVRNVIVGFVFLGSLAILGAVSLFLQSVPLFAKQRTLDIRFPSVNQLEEGDDVIVRGLRVGQVDSIRYQPEISPAEPVLVKCTVLKTVTDQLESATGKAEFTIESSGPLGGRFLEIKPPPPPAAAVPQPEGFVGEASGDLFAELRQFVNENRDSIRNAIEEIRKTFASFNAGEGTLGTLLKDQETAGNVKTFIKDLTDQIAALKEERGTLGMLINNATTRDDVSTAVADVRAIARDIREGKGVLSQLLNDDRLASSVAEAIDDFHQIAHKVNTGQGTLGQIVNNPRAWDEVVKVLVLLRETVEDFREQAPISTFVNAVFAAF